MKKFRPDSSYIHEMTLDLTKQYPLVVCFVNGSSYEYKIDQLPDGDTDLELLFDILTHPHKSPKPSAAAMTVGQFFAEYIRDKCPYNKLPNCDPAISA